MREAGEREIDGTQATDSLTGEGYGEGEKQKNGLHPVHGSPLGANTVGIATGKRSRARVPLRPVRARRVVKRAPHTGSYCPGLGGEDASERGVAPPLKLIP